MQGRTEDISVASINVNGIMEDVRVTTENGIKDKIYVLGLSETQLLGPRYDWG